MQMNAPKSKQAVRRQAPMSKYPDYRKLLKIYQDIAFIQRRLKPIFNDLYVLEPGIDHVN